MVRVWDLLDLLMVVSVLVPILLLQNSTSSVLVPSKVSKSSLEHQMDMSLPLMHQGMQDGQQLEGQIGRFHETQ